MSLENLLYWLSGYLLMIHVNIIQIIGAISLYRPICMKDDDKLVPISRKLFDFQANVH